MMKTENINGHIFPCHKVKKEKNTPTNFPVSAFFCNAATVSIRKPKSHLSCLQE